MRAAGGRVGSRTQRVGAGGGRVGEGCGGKVVGGTQRKLGSFNFSMTSSSYYVHEIEKETRLTSSEVACLHIFLIFKSPRRGYASSIQNSHDLICGASSRSLHHDAVEANYPICKKHFAAYHTSKKTHLKCHMEGHI